MLVRFGHFSTSRSVDENIPEDCNSAGFCVCVCKDPENCPSTVETLSPEEAAKQAAEAHAWNEAGGPNQGK